MSDANVDTEHPQYMEASEIWGRVFDCFEGESTVKAAGMEYMKPTQSMTKRGALSRVGDGYEEYLRYKERAVFPEFVSEAVGHLLGVMHRKEPEITLPDKMKPLLENSGPDGVSLESFLRAINKNQLLYGRFGILVEIPDGGELPYLVGYNAPDIINWDGDRSLVVIDESAQERKGFQWVEVEQHRVLEINDQGKYAVRVIRKGEVNEKEEEVSPKPIVPEIQGKSFEEIPFVFVNAGDLTTDIDKAPMEPLSNQCLTIYRGEADYRQALHMQGQSTLVIIGLDGDDDEDVETGAGAVIYTPSDAKFIGVDPTGLPELRTSIENDRKVAVSMGAKLLDPDNEGSRASGDALRTRVAAHTANLARISLTGAEGLQDALKLIATIMGENPNEVKVDPNLDFVASGMSGKDLTDLLMGKSMGAPLSQESIHKKMTQDASFYRFCILVDCSIDKPSYKYES